MSLSAATTNPAIKVVKPKPFSYHSVFKKVLRQRLLFLLKVSVILSWILGLVISLPYHGFFNWLLLSFIKGPLIFIGLVLVKSSRELNITVDYPTYKTLGRQIVGEIFSVKYFTTSLAYVSSCFICYLLVYSGFQDFSYRIVTKEYNAKSLINDEVIFYLFNIFYFGGLYAAQHVVFQRDRLQFSYGVSRIKPEEAYFANLPRLIGNSVTFSTFSTISAPIVYIFIRKFIYGFFLYPFYWPLNLSSQMPGIHISFGLFFRIFYTELFLTFTWEFVNHLFNVYVQIGCLYGTKPLSTFSNDPINTLLTGLRDTKHPLVRLTAFQELAYLATSDDPKTRLAFYNAHSKTSYVWLAILEECSLVIKENCRRLKSKTSGSSPITKLKAEEDKIHDFIQPKEEIFGNSHSFDTSIISTGESSSKDKLTPKPSRDFVLSTKDSTTFRLNESLKKFTNEKVTNLNLNQYLEELKSIWRKTCSDFLKSGVGIFFRKTMKREAESRCQNPINFGNAILSISYLLIHSADEDKVGVVSGTLTEVLVLLEKSVSTCGLFTENPPSDVYDSNKNHAVGLLHDLSMKCFFDVTVKYNALLNDLLLPPDVFKLAKWTIDVAISQQKQFDDQHILDSDIISHI